MCENALRVLSLRFYASVSAFIQGYWDFIMHIAFNNLSATKVYHLLTQSVVPRPIAWVLTQNEADEGKLTHNLAPFSYFTPVASNPPLLMISIGKKSSGDDKDTVVNIQREKNCTVHIANVDHMALLNASAAEMALNESEVDALDVKLCDFDESSSVKRIEGAPVAFKCKLHECQVLAGGIQTLVFLEIISAYLDDEIIDDEQKRLTIRTDKINPLARLGAGEYASIGDIIPLLRP